LNAKERQKKAAKNGRRKAPNRRSRTTAAPVTVTSGEGFRFEDHIAARVLLDALLAMPPVEAALGQFRRLHWQARDTGWELDDLVLETGPATEEGREAAISIKLDRQVTEQGFPPDFVRILWRHYLGVDGARQLRPGRDLLVLAVGRLGGRVQEAWDRMLSEASITTPERLRARLRKNGNQSSKVARALFESLACPPDLGRPHADDIAKLLCNVRLLSFDFSSLTSSDLKRAHSDARAALNTSDEPSATALWRRLLELSAERRSGGALASDELVRALRLKFKLREHPEYRADWERLGRRSSEALEDIGTSLDEFASIPRTAEAARIRDRLETSGVAIVAGESGTGKSGLVKSHIARGYQRVVWLACGDLDAATGAVLQEELRLDHSLADVLRAAREPALLVADGAERLSAEAMQVFGRITRAVRSAGTDMTHVVFTVQSERLAALSDACADSGVPTEAVVLDAPTEAAIQAITRSVPELRWTALRPELRPALRNLKILDWAIRAVRRGAVLDANAILNVSQLIAHLWSRLVGDNGAGLERSRLLLDLGVRDGDSFTGGVFRAPFDGRVLGDLIARGFVRLRDERVAFGHDMLGDWARLRVLLGENTDAVRALRARAARPRWHRAIRLYAQSLLDLQVRGPSAWREVLRVCDDGTDSGAIARDLLLEAVIVASNAGDRLSALWPTLIDEDGRLLGALLERFLIVATIPDREIEQRFIGSRDLHEVRLVFRVPFAPYWGAVLKTLHERHVDVCRLVPDLAASIASMWLRWTEPVQKAGIAWRREAAHLAIAIARESHARIEEGDGIRGSEKVFEALFYAAPEVPDVVASLALELAHRRDLSEDVARRRERAASRREENRKALEKSGQAKQIPSYLTASVLGRGPIRSPWPHGPARRVDEAFADACRAAAGGAALASLRASAAAELVLATTIEHPKEEDPHGYRAHGDDFGLAHWMKGYPPFYTKGPWLRFLREAPEEGLTAILKLVNFATERWAAQLVAHHRRRTGEEARAPGIDLECGGTTVRADGDETVFQWHYRSSLGNGMLHSALIALEKHVYDLLDAEVDVSSMLERIVREGRSLAFVGLLLDVGKRRPALFAEVLQPLLGVWELYEVDAMKTFERSRSDQPWMMMPWTSEPAVMRKLASDWFAMPHRAVVLRELVPSLLLGDARVASFFDGVRQRWAALLRDGEPESLELLIARFDPANYPTGKPDELQWPASIAKRLAPEIEEVQRSQALMFLPIQARKWLAGEATLSDAELSALWPFLQALSVEVSDRSEYNDIDPREPRDVMFALVAAIVICRPDWLANDSRRARWCRDALERATSLTPPAAWGNLPTEFEKGFDAFVAEAGVALLARDHSDALARRLVAAGVTSKRDTVIDRLFRRAFLLRDDLGDDFRRMQRLATIWALHRFAGRRARHLEEDDSGTRTTLEAIRREFVESTIDAGTVAVCDPVLDEVDDPNIDDADDDGVPHVGREGQLDRNVIRAAFGWLDVPSARDDTEQKEWLALVEQCQTLAFSRLKRTTRRRRSPHPDIPDEFALWTMACTVRALPHIAHDAQIRLATPYLDRGSHEHHWVESFLRQWLVVGAVLVDDFATFAIVHDRFLEHALTSAAWKPRSNRDYDVARIVCELLGFRLLRHPEMVVAGRAFLDARVAVFERAAARWFSLAPVLAGFVRLVLEPVAQGLRLRAVAWVAAALFHVDEDDWDRVALTDALASYLRMLWQEARTELTLASELRAAFEAVLTAVAARGSPAAAALRDDILDS
jgi:hypothetical protein